MTGFEPLQFPARIGYINLANQQFDLSRDLDGYVTEAQRLARQRMASGDSYWGDPDPYTVLLPKYWMDAVAIPGVELEPIDGEAGMDRGMEADGGYFAVRCTSAEAYAELHRVLAWQVALLRDRFAA
ncbi:MAG: hypothetical protein AB8G96_06975 [Phycisphaerales bacterium]